MYVWNFDGFLKTEKSEDIKCKLFFFPYNEISSYKHSVNELGYNSAVICNRISFKSWWNLREKLKKLNEYAAETPKKSLLRGWGAKGRRNIIEELLMYILWAHLFLQRLIKQKTSQHHFFSSEKRKGSKYTLGYKLMTIMANVIETIYKNQLESISHFD